MAFGVVSACLSCRGDAGGLCGRCSPSDSLRAACVRDSGGRRWVPGRRCLHLSHPPLGPAIGFALQETPQGALWSSGTRCCDSNATPGAVTAVLLLPSPGLHLLSAHSLVPRETLAVAGTRWPREGSCQPRDRAQGSRVRPCALVPGGSITPGTPGRAGAGVGMGVGRRRSIFLGFGGKHREKLPLWVEIQDKTPQHNLDC